MEIGELLMRAKWHSTKYLTLKLLLGGLLIQNAGKAQSETEVPLYASEIPNSIPTTLPERKTYNEAGQLSALSRVIMPRLLVYRPVTANGTSIILCPGGGYRNLNIENVRFIAQRLNKLGITAFILTYRLPADSLMVDRSIGALQDVQQALRLVRLRAAEWGLLTDRVGLWGSSAGGHLAAMAATHTHKSYTPNKDTLNVKPDFLVLAWPVVSFRPKVAHRGSMKNILGEQPTERQIADFSPDEQVTSTTPPTFLVHASDDPSVPATNSILFYEALKKKGVSAELHIYEKGGHGFGIDPNVKNTWMTQLEVWLSNRKLISLK